jgi:hypothetical protein
MLSANILSHISNGHPQVIDPLDPRNRLYPFCAVRPNFRIAKNSALILEKVLKAVLKRPR